MHSYLVHVTILMTIVHRYGSVTCAARGGFTYFVYFAHTCLICLACRPMTHVQSCRQVGGTATETNLVHRVLF